MTLKKLNSTTVAVLRLWFYRLLTRISDIFQVQCLARLWCSLPRPTPPLCVQMNFTQTFQTNTKCKNINLVWSHFCNILVVLKYHRCLWANIFDTDICRSINIPKKGQIHHFNASRNVCVKVLTGRHLWYFKTTKIL